MMQALAPPTTKRPLRSGRWTRGFKSGNWTKTICRRLTAITVTAPASASTQRLRAASNLRLPP